MGFFLKGMQVHARQCFSSDTSLKFISGSSINGIEGPLPKHHDYSDGTTVVVGPAII